MEENMSGGFKQTCTFCVIYNVGHWNNLNSLKKDCLGLLPPSPPDPRGGHNQGQSTQLLNITQFLKVSFKICGTVEIFPKPD